MDVKIVNFQAQSIIFPPAGLHNVFPNIEVLIIKNSELKYLKRSYFKGLEGLMEIDFSNNLINKLSEDTFDDLVQLQVLTLLNNLLIYIPQGIFKNLVSLVYLEFDENQLEIIPEGLFKNNLELDTIKLSGNQLIIIPSDTFSHLTKKRNIELAGNPCFDLEVSSLEELFEKLEGYLEKNCNKTCADLTKELAKYVEEATNCEDEVEIIWLENVELRNQQKACLLL